jgi:hypothetical protein
MVPVSMENLEGAMQMRLACAIEDRIRVARWNQSRFSAGPQFTLKARLRS